MGPFRLLDLPPELMDNVLEHVPTLDDLGALSLTSRRVNLFCNRVSATTLRRITERCTYTKVYKLGDMGRRPERRRSQPKEVVMAAFNQPLSRPYKVREWLYRRGSRRWFGGGEDLLEGWPRRLLDGQVSEVVDEWRILKRHIAMHIATQRVQRVDRSDLTAKGCMQDVIVSDEEDRHRSD